MKKTAIILLIALTCAAVAAVPPRDWPTVVATPVLDVPMRDAAITRGPGGAYYLTGTLAAEPGARRRSPKLESTRLATAGSALSTPDTRHSTPDFDNCRGIKLWKSTDLKNWTDLGVVWDIHRDVFNAEGNVPRHTIEWQKLTNYEHGPGNDDMNLGIVEPELHHIKGDWYICFSMNGHGTGLIKSESGKPEGPYRGWAQITKEGGSPSMFADTDGCTYWVFDGGRIAKMNDGLTELVEPPRLIQPHYDHPEDWQVEKKGAQVFRDHPETVGTHGAFLFKNRRRYYLTAGEWTHRLGPEGCDDTYLAYADSLDGPWSRRMLMTPHGGGITVFQGPKNTAVKKYYHPQQASYLNSVSKLAKPMEEIEKAKNDAPFYAAYSGNDSRARCADRPTFIPLEWSNPDHYVCLLWDDVESFPKKPQHVITERGPWPWMKPLFPDIMMRDMCVEVMPDGYIYLSGSITGQPKELNIYRTKDLIHWEKIGPLWTYDQVEWIKHIPMPELKPGDTAWARVFWDVRLAHYKGNYYVYYDIFEDYKNPGPDHRGGGQLKSVSGKMEGPYESMGKVGGQLGKDSGPLIPHILHGPDGKAYNMNWINWKRVVAEANPEVPPKQWDWKPTDGGILEMAARMDPFGLEIVDGKYIYKTIGNGPEGWNPEASYDVNYVTVATPWGPVISDKIRTVPHAGAANFFEDLNGYHWRGFFGSDTTACWFEHFGLLPIKVEHQGDEIILDVEDDPDDYQKRIMGGGEIAKFKTVLETLVD